MGVHSFLPLISVKLLNCLLLFCSKLFTFKSIKLIHFQSVMKMPFQENLGIGGEGVKPEFSFFAWPNLMTWFTFFCCSIVAAVVGPSTHCLSFIAIVLLLSISFRRWNWMHENVLFCCCSWFRHFCNNLLFFYLKLQNCFTQLPPTLPFSCYLLQHFRSIWKLGKSVWKLDLLLFFVLVSFTGNTTKKLKNNFIYEFFMIMHI